MSDVDIIAKITADVNDGGWRATGEVLGDADKFDFYQEIEVWFDLYTSGGWEAFPRPGFKGHLVPESWQKLLQTSRAPFGAFTAQEILKRGRIQGIFFKDEGSPANQHQINGMTYADIIEHNLGKSGEYGHCNLVRGIWPEGIITLDLDSANSSAVDEYDLKEGNFWQRQQEIAEIDQYWLWVDKFNTLHFKPHPMFFGTLPTPVLTLTNDLLLEPLTIERRNPETIGQIKIQGHTPAGAQISGKYPPDPTAGPIVVRSGYLATTSSQMDTIAEWIYKFKNRDYTVQARIGNGLGLLLDLMDRLQITYTSSADGISWSEKKFWLHKIEVELRRNFTAMTTLGLEAENA